MGFSVIIPSFRTPSLTERAVRSALDSGASSVVVVDNASGDETLPRLTAVNDPRLVVLANDANLGFASAANLGARASKADILIFLNSDAEVNRAAASEMIAEIDLWQGRAIVGPRVVGKGGEVQPSVMTWTPWESIVRALGLNLVARRLAATAIGRAVLKRSSLAVEHATARTATKPTDASVVTGACFAIRREEFRRLGGFDERFFMYFEDLDLCRRAKASGLSIRYVPDAVVRHIGGASAGNWRFGETHARSMRQYLEKWWGWPGAAIAVLLFWIRLVGHAITLRPGTRRAFRAFVAAL